MRLYCPISAITLYGGLHFAIHLPMFCMFVEDFAFPMNAMQAKFVTKQHFLLFKFTFA